MAVDVIYGIINCLVFQIKGTTSFEDITKDKEGKKPAKTIAEKHRESTEKVEDLLLEPQYLVTIAIPADSEEDSSTTALTTKPISTTSTIPSSTTLKKASLKFSIPQRNTHYTTTSHPTTTFHELPVTNFVSLADNKETQTNPVTHSPETESFFSEEDEDDVDNHGDNADDDGEEKEITITHSTNIGKKEPFSFILNAEENTSVSVTPFLKMSSDDFKLQNFLKALETVDRIHLVSNDATSRKRLKTHKRVHQHDNAVSIRGLSLQRKSMDDRLKKRHIVMNYVQPTRRRRFENTRRHRVSQTTSLRNSKPRQVHPVVEKTRTPADKREFHVTDSEKNKRKRQGFDSQNLPEKFHTLRMRRLKRDVEEGKHKDQPNHSQSPLETDSRSRTWNSLLMSKEEFLASLRNIGDHIPIPHEISEYLKEVPAEIELAETEELIDSPVEIVPMSDKGKTVFTVNEYLTRLFASPPVRPSKPAQAFASKSFTSQKQTDPRPSFIRSSGIESEEDSLSLSPRNDSSSKPEIVLENKKQVEVGVISEEDHSSAALEEAAAIEPLPPQLSPFTSLPAATRPFTFLSPMIDNLTKAKNSGKEITFKVSEENLPSDRRESISRKSSSTSKPEQSFTVEGGKIAESNVNLELIPTSKQLITEDMIIEASITDFSNLEEESSASSDSIQARNFFLLSEKPEKAQVKQVRVQSTHLDVETNSVGKSRSWGLQSSIGKSLPSKSQALFPKPSKPLTTVRVAMNNFSKNRSVLQKNKYISDIPSAFNPLPGRTTIRHVLPTSTYTLHRPKNLPPTLGISRVLKVTPGTSLPAKSMSLFRKKVPHRFNSVRQLFHPQSKDQVFTHMRPVTRQSNGRGQLRNRILVVPPKFLVLPIHMKVPKDVPQRMFLNEPNRRVTERKFRGKPKQEKNLLRLRVIENDLSMTHPKGFFVGPFLPEHNRRTKRTVGVEHSQLNLGEKTKIDFDRNRLDAAKNEVETFPTKYAISEKEVPFPEHKSSSSISSNLLLENTQKSKAAGVGMFNTDEEHDNEARVVQSRTDPATATELVQLLFNKSVSPSYSSLRFPCLETSDCRLEEMRQSSVPTSNSIPRNPGHIAPSNLNTNTLIQPSQTRIPNQHLVTLYPDFRPIQVHFSVRIC